MTTIHQFTDVWPVDLLPREKAAGAPILTDHEFTRCDVTGPCVFVLQNDVHFEGCHWDEHADMFLIPVEPGAHPHGLVGVIGLQRVRFVQCLFRLVSIAAAPDMLEQIQGEMRQGG